MGTTEVGITLGGKSGKMGGVGLGVYVVMGRLENRWIPIQHHHGFPIVHGGRGGQPQPHGGQRSHRKAGHRGPLALPQVDSPGQRDQQETAPSLWETDPLGHIRGIAGQGREAPQRDIQKNGGRTAQSRDWPSPGVPNKDKRWSISAGQGDLPRSLQGTGNAKHPLKNKRNRLRRAQLHSLDQQQGFQVWQGCDRCGTVETMEHLLYECEHYSAQQWEELSDVITQALREKTGGVRTTPQYSPTLTTCTTDRHYAC